jgi:DNA-binding XRE family transcriptional regulator
MTISKFSNLKAIRIKHGLTQDDIAERINISGTSYNKRENGKLEFTLSELITLAIIFNLSKEQIYDIFFIDELRQKKLEATKN